MTKYENEQKQYEALLQTEAGQAVAQGYTVHQAVEVQMPPSRFTTPTPMPIPPPFPIDTLPVPIKAMAEAVSANMSVSVDLPAVVGLATVSACLCGVIHIRIRNDWDTLGNLFFLPVVASGGGKTPVFKTMAKPLFSWQETQNRERLPLIKGDEAVLKTLEARQTKAINKGDTDEARAVAKEIVTFKKTMARPLERFIGADATPEALIEIMAGNDHGAVSVLDDDAGQFIDILGGKYQTLPDLSPWLKGFDGGVITSKRKGGHITVDSANMTCLMMVQRGVLEDMKENRRIIDRGLLARFLICAPPPVDEIGSEPDIPQAVKQAYQREIDRCLRLSEQTLTLSPEATDCLMTFRKNAKGNPEWSLLDDFQILPKLISVTPRIAGVLHLLGAQDPQAPIGAKYVRDAIAIVEYFASHMQNLFSPQKDMLSKEAKGLFVRMKPIMSKSELWQKVRSLKAFKNNQRAFETLIAELVQKGYICLEEIKTGGKPTIMMEQNPSLLTVEEGETL